MRRLGHPGALRRFQNLERIQTADTHSREMAVEWVGTEIIAVEDDYDLFRMPPSHYLGCNEQVLWRRRSAPAVLPHVYRMVFSSRESLDP